jgi:predicted Zn-dependent protease
MMSFPPMKQNDLYSLIKKNKQDRHVISFFTSPLLVVALTTIITSHSQADTSQPASSVVQPIENLDKLNIDLLQPNSQLDQQQKQIIEDKNNPKQQKPVNVTDEDVKNNPHIAEIIINTSIEKRDWKTLEKVLPLYKQSPQHDPMLVLYGQGALLRHQGKITQAIQSYQKMLDNDPTLDYVRFDIAIMLFENRQYRQAEQMFKQTVNNSQMEQNFRTLSAQFLTEIKKQEQVKGKAHLRFLHNDNVNQATNDRHLQIV